MWNGENIDKPHRCGGDGEVRSFSRIKASLRGTIWGEGAAPKFGSSFLGRGKGWGRKKSITDKYCVTIEESEKRQQEGRGRKKKPGRKHGKGGD